MRKSGRIYIEAQVLLDCEEVYRTKVKTAISSIPIEVIGVSAISTFFAFGGPFQWSIMASGIRIKKDGSIGTRSVRGQVSWLELPSQIKIELLDILSTLRDGRPGHANQQLVEIPADWTVGA